MTSLETLIEGKGFTEVEAEGYASATVQEVTFVVHTLYMFAEAGPYQLSYPDTMQRPLLVTRGSLTLILRERGKPLLALHACPELREPLIALGYGYYADAPGL